MTLSPLLTAHEGLAERAFVGQAVLEGVSLGRSDESEDTGLPVGRGARGDLGADRHHASVHVLGVDNTGVAQLVLDMGNPRLDVRLLVLGVVVLGVLCDIAELARNANPVGDLAALVGAQHLDFLRELLVALGGEKYVLQDYGLQEARVGIWTELWAPRRS